MKKMPRLSFGVALVLALGVLFGALAVAQDRGDPDLARKQLEFTRSHYTKFEYRIPMRDGVKLFTAVYVPKDKSQAYPIMMQRTPYSVAPYGIDNYRPVLGPSSSSKRKASSSSTRTCAAPYLRRRIRRRPFHKTRFSGPKDTDESTDTYDTIDWLVKNLPNNNGKAGIWGISYGGFFAAFALIDAHPALKAVSPQAPMGDVGNGDDAFHNGAFYLSANFGFYRFFRPRQGGPSFPGTLPASTTAPPTPMISFCAWDRSP